MECTYRHVDVELSLLWNKVGSCFLLLIFVRSYLFRIVFLNGSAFFFTNKIPTLISVLHVLVESLCRREIYKCRFVNSALIPLYWYLFLFMFNLLFVVLRARRNTFLRQLVQIAVWKDVDWVYCEFSEHGNHWCWLVGSLFAKAVLVQIGYH